MIGVIHKPDEREIAEEFFQLFKTPWEPFTSGRAYDVVLVTTNDAAPEDAKMVLREPTLFEEVRRLLTAGQSVDDALAPALDLRINKLRQTIIEAGIPLIEIPPTPAGYPFTVCLTHDIDFVGIRQHKFDHTMWGFLYRSTIGALRDLVRGRIGFGKLLRIWKAAASLPFVYVGLMKDFWNAFEWYLRVERGLAATYYLIPFKRRMGEKVAAPDGYRRATAYDVTDIPEWVERLRSSGCEVGVHGIDAWHSVEKGREELGRVKSAVGIRMHWLLADAQTANVLEQAGYAYDSTVGYNETVGFRAGTTQVYLPPGNRTMLELPMHIQDGALFFPERLNASESAARELCDRIVQHAQEHGGVVTLLWHDRSHGPERFWGEFYERLVERLKGLKVWFASGSQAVGWFRSRREVEFNGMEAMHDGAAIQPPLRVRMHTHGKTREIAWAGGGKLNLEAREEAVLAQ